MLHKNANIINIWACCYKKLRYAIKQQTLSLNVLCEHIIILNALYENASIL